MSSLSRLQARKTDKKTLEFVRGISAVVERQTLARIRDYLGRGRPLAGLPIESLGAQWIDAHLDVHVLEDDGRALELRDLGSEFDLRGATPPFALVAPEVTRFRQRFQAELRKRKPDPMAWQRIEAELEDARDRLLESLRAS